MQSGGIGSGPDVGHGGGVGELPFLAVNDDSPPPSPVCPKPVLLPL